MYESYLLLIPYISYFISIFYSILCILGRKYCTLYISHSMYFPFRIIYTISFILCLIFRNFTLCILLYICVLFYICYSIYAFHSIYLLFCIYIPICISYIIYTFYYVLISSSIYFSISCVSYDIYISHSIYILFCIYLTLCIFYSVYIFLLL